MGTPALLPARSLSGYSRVPFHRILRVASVAHLDLDIMWLSFTRTPMQWYAEVGADLPLTHCDAEHYITFKALVYS